MDEAFKQVIDALRDGSHFLLCSHVRSDPDAIGSELGLWYLLRELGKEVEIANHGGVDHHCRWLPNADRIESRTEDLTGNHDTVLTVDCANRERLGDMEELVVSSGAKIINIDHHATNEKFGDVNWIEAERSSVGEMIFEIWARMSPEIWREPATCLYASLVSDTGQFAFPQTSARSHEVAAVLLEAGVDTHDVARRLFQDYEKSELELMAYVIHNVRQTEDRHIAWSTIDEKAYENCGAEPWDSQPYVQLVMQLKGVEIGLLLRRLRNPEISGKYQGDIKGSLRSRGTYDVGKIAGLFGGGGHPQAAGFVMEGEPPMEEVEADVIQRIKEVIDDGTIARQ